MTVGLSDATVLPQFPAITPAAIAPALETVLADYETTVARLTATRPTGFAQAWLPLERSNVAVAAFWSAVSHLQAVADTPELRSANAAGQSRLVATMIKVQQDRDLHDLYAAVSSAPDFARLPLAGRVAVERAIRDARLAGVALASDARERSAAITVELSVLADAFSSAVLDATDAWVENVTDEATLAGLSSSDTTMLAAAARTRGLDRWAVTLQQPSVTAVLTFAEDRDLRERVYRAFGRS